MHRRIVVFAMAAIVSLSSASTLYAAPFGVFHHSAADGQSTGKLIHFNLRNDSKQSMTVQAGDQQFTVEAGKTVSMKLAEGVAVIAVNGTAKSAPGSVITTVSAVLQNNTLAVN